MNAAEQCSFVPDVYHTITIKFLIMNDATVTILMPITSTTPFSKLMVLSQLPDQIELLIHMPIYRNAPLLHLPPPLQGKAEIFASFDRASHMDGAYLYDFQVLPRAP